MKRIIIIGATSGIGLEVARCYLKDGWQVGVAGRREEELEKLRQSAPGQVCTQRIDVTREDAPALLEQLIMKTGRAMWKNASEGRGVPPFCCVYFALFSRYHCIWSNLM